jgi:uncharacterized protein (DUF427 family)
MARALWRDTVIAESAAVERVEGKLYFPPRSVHREFLIDSEHTTVCSWKGMARYYSLCVDGFEYPDAAWYYADPKPDAAHIRDHVAFYGGIAIEE